MRTLECPVCKDDVEVAEGAEFVQCDCGEFLQVSVDAEFVDGSWRDLSALRRLPVIENFFDTERKTKKFVCLQGIIDANYRGNDSR